MVRPSASGGLPFAVPGGLQELLGQVARFLSVGGVAGYLVGGFVRDGFLGRQTQDVDLAVAAPAIPLARELAGVLGGHFVLLDQEHGIARVVTPGGWHLDLATLAGDINQDMSRRDFTVNAVAVALEGGEADSKRSVGLPDIPLTIGEVVDPCGGLGDLERGLIRAVSPGVFKEDAARLLRAVRLAAELDYRVEEATAAQVKREAHLLGGVAGERLREELMRLLSLPRAAPGVRTLDGLGLLSPLFPQLDSARGVAQPKEHHWDVFQHSIETVAAADFLTGAGDDFPLWAREDFTWPPEAAARMEEQTAGFPRRALLKLACLLHDVAKPQTKAVQPDGRTRFLGHPRQGADMARQALGRLRFSRREAETVAAMITHHLRPTQMGQGAASKRSGGPPDAPPSIGGEMPTRRAIYRFFRDVGEVAVEVLFLSLADHLATRGPGLVPEPWRYHTRMVAYVLEERYRQDAAPPARLLTGHDIMAAFNLEPGLRVGQLLEVVEEARAAGEISTREEALALVRKELGG